MNKPEPIRTRKPRGAIKAQFDRIAGTAEVEVFTTPRGRKVKVETAKKALVKKTPKAPIKGEQTTIVPEAEILTIVVEPKKARKGLTREGWLQKAVDALRPDFEAIDGVKLSDVHVSIGWPGGHKKQNVIGECWSATAVGDRKPAIFISPKLTEKDPVRILGVLVHELVHAAGNQHHRSSFAKLAGQMGLVKPWTATGESEPLKQKLQKLADKLGPFPHSVINGGGLYKGPEGPGDEPPVQGTRMLKLTCPEDGYLVRTTAKWVAVGLPSCPDGHELVLEAKGGEEEDPE